ncbi:MAG: hypothetical protein J6Q85_06410 [Clostridia bacterium]|nr:hypothetical protein [Clostridia bacterium]
MRINKQQLEKLVALPDEELWKQIVAFGKGYGVTMPEKAPSHDELTKLRGIISGGKISLTDAAKILNQYRKGGGV